MTKNIKTSLSRLFPNRLFSSRLFLAGLLSLFLVHPAAAQTKVTIAVGGGACLCYLPTVLAKQLGEYEKAGLAVELVDLKGGSDALKAVLGGSADVVSGYFDHCVNLAAKKQELQSFVVYDRYPGLVLVVSPKHTGKITSIKDLAGKKVGEVSAQEKRPRSGRHGGDRRRPRRDGCGGDGAGPDRSRRDARSCRHRAAG
jgi:NitT/TauT family transport system substrate-binding protein